jgi:uncharacterized protein YciI
MSEAERAFLVRATLAPDAAARRASIRPEHLGRLRRLMATGDVIAVGALEDMSLSILIVRAEDEAAVRRLIDEDVYVASGVWTEIAVDPMQLVRP